MSSDSSPGRKLLSQVSRDRIITKFPQAFHPDGTPYQMLNFDARVKEACTRNRTGAVGLKICKAVIVGDVAVGKSCLVNRFCHDVFDRDYKTTIGVDFEVEKFTVMSVPFNLQLWDTAGQERFKCIAASYYRGANVVIVTFDLTDTHSLANASNWKEVACTNCVDPIVFLVGTKKDLMSDASYREMEKVALGVANDLQAEFWTVSSKTGENVKDFFFRAVSLTFDRAVLREIDHMDSQPKAIGSNLIKVEKKPEELYEKSNSKLKCCG